MVLEAETIFDTAQKGADEFFVQEAEERLTPRFIIKTADESVTSSTVVQDDDELFISISADSVYEFELFALVIEGAGVTDINITFTGPTGSIGRYWQTAEVNSISTSFDAEVLGTDQQSGATPVAPRWSTWKGWIKTDITAGNIQFKWAQGNSNASPLTVKADSWMQVTRQ